MLLPEGIMYNKETDTVRTRRVNALFAETSALTGRLKKKPNDNFKENYHLASGVALHGHFSNHFITRFNQTRKSFDGIRLGVLPDLLQWSQK